MHDRYNKKTDEIISIAEQTIIKRQQKILILWLLYFQLLKICMFLKQLQYLIAGDNGACHVRCLLARAAPGKVLEREGGKRCRILALGVSLARRSDRLGCCYGS